MSEVKRIRIQLHSIYRGPAWHGLAIREVLEGVTPEKAAAHPMPGAHSIWELVLHMTYWRGVITAALDGAPVNEHPPAGEDFPAVGGTDAVAWAAALAGLDESQKVLTGRLKTFEDERLQENVANRDYSLYFALHGLIQHDVYHLGQIALLKKG